VFPPIYVATIRANEKTGALAEAIERFIHYRSQIDLVRKRVTAAAIYPSLILAVGGLVILFLLLYVVPRFAQVFDDLGDRIPAMSRLLLQWGQLVHEHGLAVLLVLCAVPLAVLLLLARPEVRAWLGRAVTRIPRIGEFVRVYQLARFYRTLGMLLRAGIPAVPALSMVTALLPMSLRAALDEARHEVEEGRSLSMALDAHRLATPVSLRMMRVGERTGQMGEMMERIAAFHDDDVAQTIDWFVRLFEPLLMVALGVIIGVIVLLMYAPIFELAGAIQ
jgi:general secretion pathway protein F